jgi:hypothetical protein
MVVRIIKLLLPFVLISRFAAGCTPFLVGPSEPNSSLVIGRILVNNNYPGSFYGLLPLGELDKGLEVEIETRDGKQWFKVTTEEQGYFIIPNISPATYHVLRVIIEGTRSSGATERQGVTIRRPTFTPALGKITYIGTVRINLSERGISKIQEVREAESAKAYFVQKYAASPWAAREFVPAGLAAAVAQVGAKVERPEWKVGYEWRYAWKEGGRSGTYTNEMVREEEFDGRPAYVVRSGKNEDYYAKDVVGLFARKAAGRVVFKRSEPRQNFLWPLEIGKEWTNSYSLENIQNNTSEMFNYRMVVAKAEEIMVPAGTFETFKVEVFTPRTGKLFGEYWYSPTVKAVIKEKEYRQNGIREVELLGFKAD